jgi:peptidoglycan/LPS O-acetylase OafA/YrhL
VLRGIAILMVLVQHLPTLLLSTLAWWSPSGWLHRVFLSAGVDIFFCISGFVVARTLRRDLNGLGLREALHFTLKFWTRRAFRLWPVAWLGLVVAFLVSEYFNRLGTMNPALELQMIPAGIGMYADFLAGHSFSYNQRMGTMGQYWSLSLEEQFYAALPVVMILARRAIVPVLLVYICLWWALTTHDWAAQAVFRQGCLIAGVMIAYLEGGSIWRRLAKIKTVRHHESDGVSGTLWVGGQRIRHWTFRQDFWPQRVPG